MKKYWMVETAHGISSYYETLPDAKIAAERISVEYPGVVVSILELISTVKFNDETKTPEWDSCEPTQNSPVKHRPRVMFRGPNKSYEGTFLGWGKDCQPHGEGMAEYTCALIILDEGSIATIKADQVTFLDKYE